MRSAVFLPAARDEFLAQLEYDEAALPGLGVRFATAVEDATSRALTYPMAGHPLASGTRRVLTRGFPFSVVYRPIDEGVVVVAVPHHSRAPNDWKPRHGQARR